LSDSKLENRRIVVGVTGSIAAYKACDIVRMLKKEGSDVKVVMTRNALKFVSSLTFETLSGNEVIKELFPENKTIKTRHISIAEWADVILIAPATANIIGKIASGIADDFLTTLVMASRAPVIIAPAMDYQMVQNPIYLDNCRKLEKSGYKFIPTEEGPLASGAMGPGRLADFNRILNEVTSILLGKDSLKGKKVLVSAGPTLEPIDPVRFISNHSSGKMGYAVAEAAFLRGADVTLVSGPVHLKHHFGVKRIDVTTAEEMNSEIVKRASESDILIMAAAVSDFRPEIKKEQKIKKEGEFTLKLRKNSDILLNVAKGGKPDIVVGFAMETENGEESALKKLREKGLDMICLNNLFDEGAGFGGETNLITIFYRDGKSEKLPLLQKWQVADKLLDRIENLL